MRRFLLHVLPPGFVKIRHFGLYAAGSVNSKLAVARADIDRQCAATGKTQIPSSPPQAAPVDWRDLFRRLTGIDLGSCPHCGHRLASEPLTQTTHASRAPPPVEP